VPVVYPEERAAGPVLRLLELGLDDVQYYGDSVLVVVPDYPLVRVRRVRSHHAVSLARVLRRLVRLHELDYRGVELVLNVIVVCCC